MVLFIIIPLHPITVETCTEQQPISSAPAARFPMQARQQGLNLTLSWVGCGWGPVPVAPGLVVVHVAWFGRCMGVSTLFSEGESGRMQGKESLDASICKIKPATGQRKSDTDGAG